MFKDFLLVFLGGGLGSVARFGVARWLSQLAMAVFPFAAMGVNIVGSLFIGFFLGFSFISEKSSYIALLTIGFCGGFTTFSAFSWENFNLLRQGDVLLFFVYVLLSIVFCLFATWAGYSIGKII